MGKPTTYRPPVKIIGTEIDTENLVITKDGDIRHSNRVIIAESDGVDADGNAYVGIDALKSGYYCAKCLEPQDEAFPEKCWLCGFAMRDKQGEFFAKGYQGNVRVGPNSTLDTEMAAMEEWEHAQARKADPRKAASQILIPGRDFPL